MTLNGTISFVGRNKLHLIFGVVYFVMSIYAMLHFLHGSNLGDKYYRTSYNAMMKGTAWKPFVYRVFIPRMTVFIDDLTPKYVRQNIGDGFKEWLNNNKTIHKYLPGLKTVYKDSVYKRLVTTVLIYICLWGYIIAMYLLAKHLFAQQQAMWYFAPIFGMFAITSFSWQWIYIYDIPLLFFSTACYLCIARRNLSLYIALFAFACLNKETAVFLTLFFMFWFYKRIPARQYIMLLLLQCAIFIVIRGAIYDAFSSNPGPFLENNTFRILTRDILGKSKYFQLIGISVIMFMLTFNWKNKPDFLKVGLWLIPPYYLAYVLYGYPGEYRVFFDIMPLLLMLVTHTLVVGTGIYQSPVFIQSMKKDNAE